MTCAGCRAEALTGTCPLCGLERCGRCFHARRCPCTPTRRRHAELAALPAWQVFALLATLLAPFADTVVMRAALLELD